MGRNISIHISGDTESAQGLWRAIRRTSGDILGTSKTTVIKDNLLTDWKEVSEICHNGDASKKFKLGQFLSCYSPIWGFLEWEIVRVDEHGLFVISRHPVVAMPFDAPEKSLVGKTRNIGCRHNGGSNNPLYCAPHKFLNRAEPAGKWWYKSNEFDCAPEELSDFPGFIASLPGEFLDCVQYTEVEMEIPECDGGGTGIQSLRFFLPSRQELFPTDGNEPYFKLATMKKGGCYWWLRSPCVGSSVFVSCVYSSGALDGGSAYSTLGVVPACRIG